MLIYVAILHRFVPDFSFFRLRSISVRPYQPEKERVAGIELSLLSKN
jgi:hypothetical protein